MAGIDVALWDIAGKAAGRSVSDLLDAAPGQTLRPYASLLFGDTPAATHDLARRFAAAGFTAIKFGWGPMGRGPDEDIELVRQAKRGAGPDVQVLVDAGQVWDWETALERAHAFTEFDIGFLEEPSIPKTMTAIASCAGRVRFRSPPARPNRSPRPSNVCSIVASISSSPIPAAAEFRPWSRSAGELMPAAPARSITP